MCIRDMGGRGAGVDFHPSMSTERAARDPLRTLVALAASALLVAGLRVAASILVPVVCRAAGIG